MSYICSTCGEIHDNLPDIGDDKPYYWYTIPEQDRENTAQLAEDTCIIANEDYFIRGVISIPIHDYEHDFGFGVWVSQKKENFYKYVSEFESDQIGPFFGWLSTEIAYYDESTLNLHTTAHFVGNGGRPKIKVEPSNHQLAIDQQQGITLAKAWEIVHFYMNKQVA